MNVALLTIWREKNYGAELQAYATIKVLRQLGHDVKMIDIRLSDIRPISLKGYFARPIILISPCHRKFCRFWEKHIPTTRRYHTVNELKENPPIADVYMVGSDQVWNPDITKAFSQLYFLDFGSDDVKRISYASSFGNGQWQRPMLKDRVQRLIKRFEYVSCREVSGVAILRDVFDVSAQSVIDPTLLLDDYSELTGEIREKPTLVYYPLTTDVELCDYATNLAKRLCLKPVNNKQCSYLFGRIEWDRVGIEEWVRNIAETQFVITRSFHGMIFSVLFNRQFAILAGRYGRSARLTDFMDRLGLSNRYFASFNELETAQPWLHPIDYTRPNAIVQQLRKESLDYLNKALTL